MKSLNYRISKNFCKIVSVQLINSNFIFILFSNIDNKQVIAQLAYFSCYCLSIFV